MTIHAKAGNANGRQLQSYDFNEDSFKYTSNGQTNPVPDSVAPFSAQFIAERLGKCKQTKSNEWLVCCPAHADNSPSLQIKTVNNRVLVHCWSGCSQASVINALKGLRLWPSYSIPNMPPFQPEKKKEVDWIRRKLNLEKIWHESKDITNTPVEIYLRNRGFGFASQPQDLRFHPGLGYWHEGDKVGNFPAMIAPVRNKDGKVLTIHRTYLSSDGQKADLPGDKRKLMSPASTTGIAGGSIQLVPPGVQLGVAEGIEKALQCHQASGLPVWSAINANGLSRVEIPDFVQHVAIFADNDKSGAGQRSAAALKRRLEGQGKKVTWFQPATPGIDFSVIFGGN